MSKPKGAGVVKWNWLVIAIAALLAFSSCSSPRRGQPVIGPLTPSTPAIAEGRRVFMQQCHMCHPGGEGGLGPAINNKPLPGFLMRAQVRHGFGVMPEFDERSIHREELDALVTYMKALRQQRPERHSTRPRE